ncbi:hypothetical protein HID58_009358 [Brassica napus]|uniref:Uncharacterized protein n=1 Tax=Brassica napus TaxID=3708 RepID=A0ABQ8DUX5_BRANA|nr:hypothetical protein HID58_009358 [Brassica napus]
MESLQYCGSLQKLDLSSNRFSGNIPPKLCTCHLITRSLGECRFVNPLVLSENRWCVWWYYYTRKRSSLNKGVSSLAQRLCSHLLAQVSSIQKPLVKVKLGDLMGTTYKAVLPDGSALAVKHLRVLAWGEGVLV